MDPDTEKMAREALNALDNLEDKFKKIKEFPGASTTFNLINKMSEGSQWLDHKNLKEPETLDAIFRLGCKNDSEKLEKILKSTNKEFWDFVQADEILKEIFSRNGHWAGSPEFDTTRKENALSAQDIRDAVENVIKSIPDNSRVGGLALGIAIDIKGARGGARIGKGNIRDSVVLAMATLVETQAKMLTPAKKIRKTLKRMMDEGIHLAIEGMIQSGDIIQAAKTAKEMGISREIFMAMMKSAGSHQVKGETFSSNI